MEIRSCVLAEDGGEEGVLQAAVGVGCEGGACLRILLGVGE